MTFRADCDCLDCTAVRVEAYAENERRNIIFGRHVECAHCDELCEARCDSCEGCEDCCECLTCEGCGDRDRLNESYSLRITWNRTQEISLCEGCAEDNYVVDDNGGDLLARDNAYSCTGCDYTYSTFDDYTTDCTGAIWCESCASEYLRYCEDTEDYRHYEECYYSESDDCYYAEQQRDGLLSYSSNPLQVVGPYCGVLGQRVAFSRSGRNLLLGVELECDARNYCGEVVDALRETDFFDWGICKSDATVSGPEMCLIPADLYTHKTLLNWERWMETLRPVAKGHYATSAGMHVHINSRAFSTLTLGKMLVFMNSHTNLPLLNVIAQRDIDKNTYCTANPRTFDKVGKSGCNPHTGKFAPLHWKTHTGTAEIRIFRSSLLPERIFKNLEFCDALVRYCENTSVRFLNADSFVAYVSKERKQYPNLYKFIDNRTEV